MAKLGWIFGFLVLFAFPAVGDSIWNSESKGLLSNQTGLLPGDIVVVEIGASTTLSFRSAQSDSKGLSLEFAGGGQGDLFSFLPSASSTGNLTTQGSEEFSLKASIGTLIQEINPTGMIHVQGTRRISLENREESITVSGWLNPADLDSRRVVQFERLADSRITFQTLVQPAKDVLTGRDLANKPPAGTTAAVTGGTTPPPAGSAASGSGTSATQLELSEAKKRELLLQYLNRIVDILFQ